MQALLSKNLTEINTRIACAARRSGRQPEDVRLVAVTKTHPVAVVRAALNSGVTIIGENYIQEARAKFEEMAPAAVAWHFIGHLQSNKAKYAVRMFDLIHTVDSVKLATELDRQARKAGKVQAVLVQVNLAGEATKSGISEQATRELLQELSTLRHIKVKGLMTLPPYFDQPEKARPAFAALRQLRDRIAACPIPNIEMRELSMGMTGDFEAAIEEGATLVRIGTALFGGRP
ncbi:MAG: hypothetical protein VR64_21790 [Desulfatitalea sp. BRH_c12]|nr:MAG: hypothetical protein VR64_21790 [Desulfatitalea sp. BRH_c12]